MTTTEIGVLFGIITTALSGIIASYFNSRNKMRNDVMDNAIKTQETLSELHSKEIHELQNVIVRYQQQLTDKEAVIIEQDKMIAKFKIEMLEYKNEIAAYRLESANTINTLRESLLTQTNENTKLTKQIKELTNRVKDLEGGH